MVGIILSTYLVLLLVLNLQPVKSIWINEIEKGLSQAVNSTVEIKDIEIGLFNRVVIDDIVIYDQHGEQMVEVEKFAVKILLRDIFQKKITLRSVLIMDGTICLYKEHPDAAPNYSFLTALFDNEESSNEPFQISVGSLIITRLNISYDNRWISQTDDNFSKDHIRVNNINSNLSLKCIDSDSLNIRVRNFSCNESDKLHIKKLHFNLVSNRERVKINNFNLTTSNSEVAGLDNLDIDIQKLNEKQPFLNGDLIINNLSTKEFNYFLPQFEDLALNIYGHVKARCGAEAQVSVNFKEKNNHFNLALTSEPKDLNIWQIKCEELFADSTLLALLPSDKHYKTNQILRRIKYFTIHGTTDVNRNTQHGAAKLLIKSPLTDGININATIKEKNIDLDLFAENLDINTLLDSEALPHQLTFSISAKSQLTDSLSLPQSMELIVHKALNHELYELTDIKVKTKVKGKVYQCQIESENPELDFHMDVSCRLNNNSISNLALNSKVKRIEFNNIGIKDTIFDGVWKGNLAVRIPQMKENLINFELESDSISVTRPSESFNLNKCNASITYSKGKPSHFTFKSDFISVDCEGVIDYATIVDTWKATVMKHVPSLVEESSIKRNIPNDKTSMSFFIDIHDGDFLKKTCLIPIKFGDGSTIQGKLYKGNSLAEIAAQTNVINYKGTNLENVSIHINSKELGAGVLVQGKKHMFDDNVQFVIGAQLHDNLLETNVEWKGLDFHKVKGNLNTITSFKSPSNIVSSVMPTTFVVGDTIWNISNGEISILDNKHLIKNLTLNTSHQNITFDGSLSSTQQEQLHVSLNDVSIGYILDNVKFNSVLFDGSVSGDAYLSLSPNSPLLQTNLKVKSFNFNNALLGDAQITSSWKSLEDRITIDGTFIEEGVGFTKAKGYVSPSENGLDLNITAQNTNIAFLRYWINNIVKDINGKTRGFCRLYGPFNQLDFSGSMRIDASLNVPANGVSYHLNDAKILMSSGLFQLEESTIIAPLGGSGTINASLRHKHLKQFTYDLNLEADCLLLYDKKRSTDMPFYATTYASGDVSLKGDYNALSLDIEVTPTDNSLIVYTESEIINPQDTNEGFIKYQDLTPNKVEGYQFDQLSSIHSPTTDMNFRFNINMNPKATLRILMDEITGDHLNLRGYGNITADYYNKGIFQLYGKYDITDGNYQMSIQDFLKKNFDIQPGSSIIFRGDPDIAQLSLNANHTVPTASLADLNIGDNFSDRHIKADCILHIGGIASNPNVSFDLDLPNINDDEKQMVRKLIATEEDLNMQVIHLLGFGKFYTYNSVSTESYTEHNQSTIVANSFISNTLSSQINEVITNAIGSKDWTFGTNLSTGNSGWTDMGVDGTVSGKLLNNRLILNGNIGYHENQYNAMRGNNIVGDFDIKYLLTPTGNVFLKAYSETNDKYFIKSALTTQGMGIQIQKEFKNLKELFGLKKKEYRITQ